jgi:hypothetical protein
LLLKFAIQISNKNTALAKSTIDAVLAGNNYINARFTIFGRNLFYVAPNSPLDPEVNTSGAGNIQGLELQSAPNNRSIGVSLNISF